MKRIRGFKKLLVCLIICSCVISNQFIVKAEDQKNTCECNGVQYASLKDAVDAVKENEEAKITMIADESTSTPLDIMDKKITLDLAGHKIIASNLSNYISVKENTVFTLNDSVGTGSIKLMTDCGISVFGGEFIMNAGIIESDLYDFIGIDCEGGKLTVNGGTINAFCPLSSHAMIEEVNITINGGQFCGTDSCYIIADSNVTITGGYFSSEQSYAIGIGFTAINSNVPDVILRGGEYHGKNGGIYLHDIHAKEDYEYSFKDVLYKDCVLSDDTTKKVADEYNNEELSEINALVSTNDVKILTKLTSDNAKVDEIKDQTYTGNGINPEIQVSYEENNLVNGQDYDIVCKDNVNTGTATVTINFKGKYTGSISKTFTIVGGTNTPDPTTNPTTATDNNVSNNNPTTVTNDTVNAKTSVKTGDSVNYIMIIGLIISGLCIVACAKKRQENMD